VRWGSLLSTLVLTAASISLPRILFSSIGLDREGLTSIIGTTKQISSGQAVDERAVAQLNALRGGQLEGVSLEQLAAVQDAVRGSGAERGLEMGAALHEAMKNQRPLGEQMRAGVLRDAERLRVFYRAERENVLLLLASLGGACFAVAVLGAFPFGRAAARFFLTMVFGLSSGWMVTLSLATAVFFWVAEFNAWPLLPGEAFAAPALFMLFCGAFVRLLDPNYPLWNGFLRGFGAPLLACLAIAGGGLMDPAPPPLPRR